MERVLMWFRGDLRLSDNPTFTAACRQGEVIPIYILDPADKIGEASQWWLNKSLEKLNEALNGTLTVYQGDKFTLLSKILKENDLRRIFWSIDFEHFSQEKKLERLFRENMVQYDSYNCSLLWNPATILKNDGSIYKVFTPFYKKGCLGYGDPRNPMAAPSGFQLCKSIVETNYSFSEKKWHQKMEKHWKVGEAAALDKLSNFIFPALSKQNNKAAEMESTHLEGILNYKNGRNFPARNNCSLLSPHLHFGEVSPNQVWYCAKSSKEVGADDLDHFLSELGWREFSYYILYHFSDLPNKNFQSKFDNFKWKNDPVSLERWKRGQTGYPIVDAGMRQLWETGYIHNRVRMIVASFLIKNLSIDWRIGADWFWDCLVDADLASNSASWQWVAGSGTDAAPYYRIFNPVLQGEKFDPEGGYTLKYVPELRGLPLKYLFCPFEAPKEVLQDVGIEPGKDYPNPIVDINKSRNEALEEYKRLKLEN